MKKIISSLLLSTTLSLIANANAASTNDSDPNNARHFDQAMRIIKNNYVEPVSDNALFKNAMKGMLEGLDPHSGYLDADDLHDLKNITSGHLSGIGLEITMEDGFIKVITPLDDTPAQKAGIKSGDIIVRIDGVLTKGMTLREAAKKMRGAKGTAVTLTLVHKDSNKPVQLKVVRADIKLQSVKGRLLKDNIGYVRISNFESTTASDLEAAVKQLNITNKSPIKGLILDLRNNPGGLLESATAVSDDFLDPSDMKTNDLVVYTKGRVPDSQIKIKALPGDIIMRAPLIILINSGSASGAEIVAGALQDHKRALIVGSRSFGKGSVQTVIPLDGDSAIKLTTALYYTPSGRSIQASGIAPDVTVDELKVTKAEDNGLSGLYAKEADLRGHIRNGQNSIANIINNNAGFVSENQLLTSDYQLAVALYLLEGMTAWQAKQH